MTFFDKPRANPGIARVVHRFLRARGPSPRQSLLEAVAPPDVPYRGSSGNALDETLDVCAAVGVIEESDEGILSLPRGAEDVAEDVASFRRHVRRQLFHASDAAQEGDAQDVDLSRAIAWFLTHDPLQPFFPFGSTQGSPEPERVQDDELGFDYRVIRNDAQWGSFVRWSLFLGFTRRMPGRRSLLLFPDPTNAVADLIESLSGAFAPSALLERLASGLPVLDGGGVRMRLEGQLGRPQGGSVSTSLSCALRRLAEKGALRLENPADAPEASRVVLSLGGDNVTVASVVVGSEP